MASKAKAKTKLAEIGQGKVKRKLDRQSAALPTPDDEYGQIVYSTWTDIDTAAKMCADWGMRTQSVNGDKVHCVANAAAYAARREALGIAPSPGVKVLD
jgi:hypothetical protein